MSNSIIIIHFILLFNLSFSQKVNGISVRGERIKPPVSNFSKLTKSNANWVSVQAYCYVKNDSSGVDYDRKKYWYSNTIEGIKNYIKHAKKNKFKVFLKPHTKIEYGSFWSGNHTCTSEKNWKILEKTYEEFVLKLAKIAEENKVEAFSIGVEIQAFFTTRKQFVNRLIKKVRKVYTGYITYCANWDEFENINFWSKLDFIGIDSYFTISDKQTPTLDECYKKMNPIKDRLKKLHKKYNKWIVFTEFGFQSRNFAGFEPWNWEGNKQTTTNNKAQAVAYQAVFDVFWKESWFLGGFTWEWYLDSSLSKSKNDNSYSPQNKLAEKVISNFYFSNNKTP